MLVLVYWFWLQLVGQSGFKDGRWEAGVSCHAGGGEDEDISARSSS